MRELFRKYLDNNCSPEEVKRLLAYFNIAENETELRRLITEWLEENDEYEKDRWQNNFYRASGLIKKQVSIEILNGSPFGIGDISFRLSGHKFLEKPVFY